MFTGLIEEIGTIRKIRPQGGGLRLNIAANLVLQGTTIDDSISINGVCQTVVWRDATSFEVEAVEETLHKTTFGSLKTGQHVNLERAMQLGGRLGGHLVQGHIDTRGRVVEIQEQQTSWLVRVEFPQEYARYIVPVGSLCVNGISLTAARVEQSYVTLAIIPHTWKHTTFHELSVGDTVNLEFDIIGKYVERMITMGVRPNPQTEVRNMITEEWLRSVGY